MKLFQTIAVLLLVSLGSLFSLDAQDREISGKVLDTNGQPVIGAAVLVSGTANGAVTADDGSFYLYRHSNSRGRYHAS